MNEWSYVPSMGLEHSSHSVNVIRPPVPFFFFFKDFIYLFLERGEERERNIDVWLPLVSQPHRGPSPQPRHVPRPGIKPATLWFTGRHSVHWATPAWAVQHLFPFSSSKAIGRFICFPFGTLGSLEVLLGSSCFSKTLLTKGKNFSHLHSDLLTHIAKKKKKE